MDWTIDLMYAVLLTSITGTFVFIIWYGIGKLLEHIGFINVRYELMKAVLLFWYVPLSFIALVCGNWHYGNWGGFLFLKTPFISRLSRVFCALWLLGAGCFMVRYILNVLKVRRNYRRAVPCFGPEFDHFEQVCRELGIKPGKVDLVYDYRESGPKLIGIFKPAVVLPVREFSEDELRVIFVHELTHYKQKNLWLKHAAEFALALHFFNPFIWIFSGMVQYWGEYACDYAVIPLAGGMKSYFAVIFRMSDGSRKGNMLMACLTGKRNELVDRMERMKRSYKMKNKAKWKAALVIGAMFLVSTTSVSAATVYAGDSYIKLYHATVVEELDEGEDIDNGPEYEMSSLEPGFEVEIGEVDQFARSGATFSWSVNSLMTKRTSDFSASSGGTITVVVYAASGEDSFRGGIIEPDGTYRYVESANGIVDHTFELDQTGTYSVFVQNMENYTINVEGYYYVR